MALMADPIFYHTIRRNSGGKRRLIYVNNPDPMDVELVIQDVEKPEWVEVEGIFPTAQVRFEKGKRQPLIANINTEHQFFPKGSCKDEKVRVTFENKQVLDIAITIPEIIDEILPFRGVFATDFGTSNSVFAFKGRAMDVAHHGAASQAAQASDEIPSAVYFHNVSDRKAPKFSIGTEALFDIKENSGRTYSYRISVKRALGQGRTFMIMDRFAGKKKEHRQEYTVEEIASFIIKEIIERAQDEIGQRVQSVVATYPPLFSRAQKKAVEQAFSKALSGLGIEVNADTLIMDLDEANAGAFNHIYGPLLDEFRSFEVTERAADLLSLDFGGGTVDISLVAVQVSRNQQGRISITTELKGLSGDPYWGGDIATLETFRLVKPRAALAAAKARKRAIDEKKAEAEAKAKAAESGGGAGDIWGGGGGAAGKADDMWGGGGGGAAAGGDDVWGTGAATAEAEKKEEAAPEEDEDTAAVVNRESPEAYEAALLTLANEEAVVEKMVTESKTAVQAVAEIEQADGSFMGEEQSRQRASLVDSSIEMVVPTQFAKYEDVDPFKNEVSRALFHELWHEVELLKIRMSSSLQGRSKISGVLKKIAKYAGVDPIVFNEVEFRMAELNAKIGGSVEGIVAKARNLYEGAQGEEEDGLTLVAGQQAERPPLRVLLLGNCSNLPIIQEKVRETFAAEGREIVFNKKNLKKAVACGACEEYALRKEFGARGLITYTPKGFLDRLPFAVGIQHRDLALMGYPRGFCPIFARGTRVGASTVLDENSAFLIHEKMADLAVFADYRDGAEPVYAGWIDFTKAVSDAELPPPPKPVEGEEPMQFEYTPQEGVFAVRFDLLSNRELLATNLRTGTKHLMSTDTENWDKNRDPFSGVH